MKVELDKGFVEAREFNVFELSEMAEIYADFIDKKDDNPLRAMSKLLKDIVPFLKDKLEKIEYGNVKNYEGLCKAPGSHQIFINIMNELMGGVSLGKSSSES